MEIEWVFITDVRGVEKKYEIGAGIPEIIDSIELLDDRIVLKRYDSNWRMEEVIMLSNLIKYMYPTGPFKRD